MSSQEQTSRLQVPTHALVRAVSARFRDAVSRDGTAAGIDLDRARDQHGLYVDALRKCGLIVEILPAQDDLPDACFVEDCAVVLGSAAMITRPGHPARLAETVEVEEALARHLDLTRLAAPATLDGGDCSKVGDVLYAGASSRTSSSGIRQLEAWARPLGWSVRAVEIGDTLHLKTVTTALGRDHVLLTENTVSAEHFPGQKILGVPAEEAYAANALAVGDRVIVSEGYPRVRELVEKAGFTILTVPTTEFRKADGSLTCLSILFTSSDLRRAR